MRLFLIALPYLCLLYLNGLPEVSSKTEQVWTEERRLILARETKDAWKHGFNGYMKYAYPEDELKPISCTGQSRDVLNPNNLARNDVNGNFALTYLDVLSTLPMMLGEEEFRKAVGRVVEQTKWGDVKVQVFEVTIRVLGSLLSSHQQLLELDRRKPPQPSPPTSPPVNQYHQEQNETDHISLTKYLTSTTSAYIHSLFPFLTSSQSFVSSLPFPSAKKTFISPKDEKTQAPELLTLAIDLADRLLPAFDTPTGIPYARVNLKTGVEQDEVLDTCSAGAGSLMLEFGLLSRLTGDPKYEVAARRAFFAIWSRRSSLDLIGNGISVKNGEWLAPAVSTIGAGIDSFYEYALKVGVIFDDDEFMEVWEDSYRAVMQYLRTPDGYVFRRVHMSLGKPIGTLLDSLSAFWPGLQVLAGDVEEAIKSHLIYWWLWRKHRAMPEGFNYVNKTVEWAGYPLRPEFVESTYHLYQATGDSFYLEVGEQILKDLIKRTKTRCGFAVIHDIRNGKLEDRMESFALSETLKYLYLLFDPSSSKHVGNKIFTTEGHLLSPPSRTVIPLNRDSTEYAGSNPICPLYRPTDMGGLLVGVKGRSDYDYSANVVGMPLLADYSYRDVNGRCEVPVAEAYHIDIVFLPSEQPLSVKEDRHPSLDKVERLSTGDVVVKDVHGVHAKVTRGPGRYDVTSVANHRIHQGQRVILTDPQISSYYPSPPPPRNAINRDRPPEVAFRFARTFNEDELPGVFLQGTAGTATFGIKFRHDEKNGGMKLGGPAFKVVKPENSELGCDGAIYPEQNGTAPFVALVTRGNCTFFEKTATAKANGAVGVIISGVEMADDFLIRPSADDEEVSAVENLGVVYVLYVAGQLVRAALKDGGVWVQFGDLEALDDGDWEKDRGHGTEEEGVVEGVSGLMIGGIPIGNLDFFVP